MKKGSKAAIAWGRKMKLLRNKPKRKSSTRKTKLVKNSIGKKRKSATTRRKSTTLNKTKVKRKSMVSRRKIRYSRRAKSGGLKIGNSLKTGIIGEVVKGIGA